jgi:hypothetical protein
MPGFAQEMSLTDLERWCAESGANLAGADMTIPLKRCAVVVKADIAENFAQGHAPDGTPWQPACRPRARAISRP